MEACIRDAKSGRQTEAWLVWPARSPEPPKFEHIRPRAEIGPKPGEIAFLPIIPAPSNGRIPNNGLFPAVRSSAIHLGFAINRQPQTL
jgi:hypothetical protein